MNKVAARKEKENTSSSNGNQTMDSGATCVTILKRFKKLLLVTGMY